MNQTLNIENTRQVLPREKEEVSSQKRPVVGKIAFLTGTTGQ